MKELYTAWELAGDWWWTEKYYAVTENGHVRYELATASKTERTVCMSRIQVGFTIRDARVIVRYVHPDTKFRLVEI